jgi:hypothetical protein
MTARCVRWGGGGSVGLHPSRESGSAPVLERHDSAPVRVQRMKHLGSVRTKAPPRRSTFPLGRELGEAGGWCWRRRGGPGPTASGGPAVQPARLRVHRPCVPLWGHALPCCYRGLSQPTRSRPAHEREQGRPRQATANDAVSAAASVPAPSLHISRRRGFHPRHSLAPRAGARGRPEGLHFLSARRALRMRRAAEW